MARQINRDELSHVVQTNLLIWRSELLPLAHDNKQPETASFANKAMCWLEACIQEYNETFMP